jgi:vacuolar-type H+-ATPase subunit E/Vma4
MDARNKQEKGQCIEGQTNLDKASYITIQWALQETKNILQKAEAEAEDIRRMATQQLQEAQDMNHATRLALIASNQEADTIVQEALEDADNIRHDAYRDAQIIKQTAEEEFQRFMSLFKDKIKCLTIQCLQDLL